MPVKKDGKGKKVEFRFKGPVNAKTVLLAGDFTDWDKGAIQMKPLSKTGEWVAKVELGPGAYEYKFLVDGTWYNDSSAPRQKPNIWGSENSVIEI